ncbi:MAG: N-6 DNA methylase [Halioglobus sp.]
MIFSVKPISSWQTRPSTMDDVDAEKIKNDPRLPLAFLASIRRAQSQTVTIFGFSYFYNYLNKEAAQALSCPRRPQAPEDRKPKCAASLVESGHVGAMVAIRSNFFYTRTVPCELWFLNKNKPAHMKDKVLMLDARNVYTKVTRKIYDFSPEQLANLTSNRLALSRPERALLGADRKLSQAHIG